MLYLIATYEKSQYGPSTFGPYETREEAERMAEKYEGREGWTVEVVYKDEPCQYRDFV